MQKIEDINSFIASRKTKANQQRNMLVFIRLLIVAEDFENGVLDTLIMNKQTTGAKVIQSVREGSGILQSFQLSRNCKFCVLCNIKILFYF